MAKKITIESRESLKHAPEDFAAKDGVSLNQFITVALAEKIGAMNAAEFFAERGKSADAERAIRFLGGGRSWKMWKYAKDELENHPANC